MQCETPTATRLLDKPIIHPELDDSIGTNINGPSLIRVPDWVKDPLGRYYLYFAHHKGGHIRLAYADNILGPWIVHRPGALDLQASLFVTRDLVGSNAQQAWHEFASPDDNVAHIASPHVLVDHEARVFRMYYHGLLPDGDQQTRLATSKDGLMFQSKEPLLGPPYFRVFAYDRWIYAISWRGQMLRSKSWSGPFEPGPRVPDIETSDRPDRVIRHAEAVIKDAKLFIFFTCIGDNPESILCASIQLGPNWNAWTASAPVLILEPELEWEGADVALEPSVVGTARIRRRELRDPCVFEDEGKTYLLYSGAGESGGIGLAELHF